MILSLLKKLTVQFEPGERERERERERNRGGEREIEGEREKGKEMRERGRGRRSQVPFHIPHTFTGDYQCPPIQQQKPNNLHRHHKSLQRQKRS